MGVCVYMALLQVFVTWMDIHGVLDTVDPFNPTLRDSTNHRRKLIRGVLLVLQSSKTSVIIY
jgi:hypothetical protein